MSRPSSDDDGDGDDDASAPESAEFEKRQRRLYDQADDGRHDMIVYSVLVEGMLAHRASVYSERLRELIERLAHRLAAWLGGAPALIGLNGVHASHLPRVINGVRARGALVQHEADANNKTAILWCTPQFVLQPLPSGPPCGLPAVPGAEAACSAPVVALLACPPFCRPAVAGASLALPSSLAPVCPSPTLSTHYSSSSALCPPSSFPSALSTRPLSVASPSSSSRPLLPSFLRPLFLLRLGWLPPLSLPPASWPVRLILFSRLLCWALSRSSFALRPLFLVRSPSLLLPPPLDRRPPSPRPPCLSAALPLRRNNMIALRHGNLYSRAGDPDRPLYIIEGGDDDSVDHRYLRVPLRTRDTNIHCPRPMYGIVVQMGGRANSTEVSHDDSVVLSMGVLGQEVLTQASAKKSYVTVIGGEKKFLKESTLGHIIVVERSRPPQGPGVKVHRLRYENGVGESYDVVCASMTLTPASAAGRRPDTLDDDDGRPAVVEERTPKEPQNLKPPNLIDFEHLRRPIGRLNLQSCYQQVDHLPDWDDDWDDRSPRQPHRLGPPEPVAPPQRPPATPASAAGQRPDDTPDDGDGRPAVEEPAVEEETRPPATPASTVKTPGDLVVAERVFAERVVSAAASSGAAAAEAVGAATAAALPGRPAGGADDDEPCAPAVTPEAPPQRGGTKKLWSEEDSGEEDAVRSRRSSGPEEDNEGLRVHMSKEEQADKFADILFFRNLAFCHEAQEKYHPKDGTPLPEADHQTVRRTLDLLAENRRGARPGTSGSPGEDDLFVVDDELRRRVKWYYFDFWSKSEEVGGIRRDTCTDPGRAKKKKKKRKKKKKTKKETTTKKKTTKKKTTKKKTLVP